MTRFKIQTVFITLLLVSSLLSCSNIKDKVSAPNIIVFLIDDMGLMDSSVPFLCDATGTPVKYPLNSFYRTPNMEKMAEQGIRFTNFYAHSVCSPTRASLMTGQNSARHASTNWINSESNNRTEFGPSDWNWKGLTKADVTLPCELQKAGYKTIHAGKAHFGPIGSEGENPLNLGFDVNIGGNSAGQPGSYYGVDGFGHINGWKARAVPGLEKYHGQDIFLTEALTIEANAAISKAHEEDKPFFLYMSHYAVHAPFQSDARFADNYKDSGKSEKAQAYATLIEGIDKSLGDIMQHVKDLGLGDNTLILFLGDNGSDAPLVVHEGYSSSSPLKGKKGHHWEGGMRVPFIAAWATPNVKQYWQKKLPVPQGAIQQQTGTVLDLLSTFCQLLDIQLPDDYQTDGFALNEQLKGKINKQRDERFLNHFPHGNHRTNYFTSLVDGDWKVIYHYPIEDAPRYELFNLKDDPFEANNLSADNPEQLAIMMNGLQSEMDEMNALYPEKEGESLTLMMPAQ
ncbi:sulfatase-like hydrolase/transferase [Carboxylicivirga sp. M1479]|uniref:sulfatase-like hydrolase/transferase n=1 Tax=Carboxylicivirga sp. M1479 TaxID=2594476 RepID=UPI0011783E5B|nr:sulfatase-like hydrolase/transferase [Carboxylicivirga sp. M1479]TRX66544.1 sulfatase-like hydrolase/transferase [Carboxylicivirga sp. M1479]